MTPPASVDPNLYDEKYFNESGGSAEFSKGKYSSWMMKALSLVEVKADLSILDIGCGRGEIISYCASLGARTVGLDYSTAAIKISASHIKDTNSKGSNYLLVNSNAVKLPFIEESFDIVFMMDIVEHLYPDELLKVFFEVKRILKPCGTLLIHTMPNANYIKFGYPVYRFLLRMIGKKLPKDSRKRVYHGEVHVNEQTPKSLKNALFDCGFKSVKVWLTQANGNWLKRFISNTYILRHILANDIFALVKK